MMVEAEGICLDYCRQKVDQDDGKPYDTRLPALAPPKRRLCPNFSQRLSVRIPQKQMDFSGFQLFLC